ncbi:MAG: serine/threonine protein kinase [Myxococcales bacterium]|nr:serine/threonine protein kinase [Myxococcales bacterium]
MSTSHSAPSISLASLLGPLAESQRLPSRRSDDLAGVRLRGRYALEQRIGSGSSGSVYRAFDVVHGRDVAVKVLHERHARDRSIVEAFEREARAAERMVHPNLVELLSFERDAGGYLFIVMELLEGDTLEQRLTRPPLPPTEWVTDVMEQVLNALDAAHDAGIVHRDVKPANVLVSEDRDKFQLRAKLCDFGVARIRKSSGQIAGAQADSMSDIGSVWGTPEYMAPEQARGLPVSPQADLYACGVMLYELTTGRLPFAGRGPRELAMQHMTQKPPPPSLFRPDMDRRLEDIILRAMAKDPAERFGNAQAMRAALMALRYGPDDSWGHTALITGLIPEKARSAPTLRFELEDLEEIEELQPASVPSSIPPPLPPEALGRPAAGAWRWLVGGLVVAAALVVAFLRLTAG